MNKKDRKAFDDMIKDLWNYDNSFCRDVKAIIGRYFSYDEKIKKRVEDPYWKNK